MSVQIKILETPDAMEQIEQLQRQVWTGSETEIVPAHMLLAVVHNGGIAIGAVETADGAEQERLVGFVFGFPGLYTTPDGPRLKHASHMMGVLPSHRDQGVGFTLKRAQWQMVRHQGLDCITWTYDPLQSRNAHLNISRLGAVCNTYLPNFYGELRDGINTGLPTDRFQVDWWVNTERVNRRLSKRARQPLDLAHYYAGGAEVINPSQLGEEGLPHPPRQLADGLLARTGARANAPGPEQAVEKAGLKDYNPILLVEVPADYGAIKAADIDLAVEWRLHTRRLFVDLFASGFLVTDFVHLAGRYARSFYVLSDGESTL
jgi:predicted GNAT superfamily acetyltransferase